MSRLYFGDSDADSVDAVWYNPSTNFRRDGALNSEFLTMIRQDCPGAIATDGNRHYVALSQLPDNYRPAARTAFHERQTVPPDEHTDAALESRLAELVDASCPDSVGSPSDEPVSNYKREGSK